MSHITELRKRIEDLSSAIERQQQILINLEISRSDARRELNAISDPMARLPVELSSIIFEYCLPDTPRYPLPDSRNAPLLLLGVCRLWDEIALATPSLWAAVHYKFQEECSPKPFELWLNRARNHPLSLSIAGYLTDDVVAMLKKHAHQVEALELSFDSEPKHGWFSFPSLQTFRISAPIYLLDCMEILRGTPLLLDCELDGTLFEDRGSSSLQPLTLAHLRHLRLGNPMNNCGAKILRLLTLPALENLLISDFDISTTDFVSFLTRSSPPLQSLHISADYASLDRTSMPLIPSLTALTLDCLDYSSTLAIFDWLPTSPDYLPNLHHLTFQGCFPSEYDTLVRWLTSKSRSGRIQLASLQIILPYDNPAHVLPAHVLVALRQLKQDGMRIHVGSEEENYIS
ncbi:hypothetical protein K438DRAFT_770648 [Mycena galopus ATCC 62051]|nr:hypothetical protein K438DRAFT_770648 [Mycena galopus ATCC 62051]